jgi:hypothetical protein
MEIQVSLPYDYWGKLLEVAHLREIQLRNSVRESEDLYKEILLAEAAEISDMHTFLETEIKLRENHVIY